jgi:TusA-related sulfurtransferase
VPQGPVTGKVHVHQLAPEARRRLNAVTEGHALEVQADEPSHVGRGLRPAARRERDHKVHRHAARGLGRAVRTLAVAHQHQHGALGSAALTLCSSSATDENAASLDSSAL